MDGKQGSQVERRSGRVGSAWATVGAEVLSKNLEIDVDLQVVLGFWIGSETPRPKGQRLSAWVDLNCLSKAE
ncbi:hypothetical protein THTE_3954 [Thermogutta terrifontis]|uniref:Uncharacterized protein n=1 Tax=Thermogutta terrifontis TaxID=1331910 RepID=A0A286RKQ6_9BACT|nr:hypothetical protein THTE_3954 [Thermogutta terrifontis]